MVTNARNTRRNPKLDLAVRYIEDHPGCIANEALMAAGYSEAEAANKNNRDQLNRRMRLRRRHVSDEEEKVVSRMCSGLEESIKNFFDNLRREHGKMQALSGIGGAGVTDFNKKVVEDVFVARSSSILKKQAEAFTQFMEKEAVKEKAVSPTHSVTATLDDIYSSPMDGQIDKLSKFGDTAIRILGTPQVMCTSNEGDGRPLQGITSRERSSHEKRLTGSPGSLVSSESGRSNKRARVDEPHAIPTVNGVPQKWTSIAHSCECRHLSHYHAPGQCHHEAKMHRPSDGGEHIDYIVKDAQGRTFVECHAGVKSDHGRSASALCHCHASRHDRCFDAGPQLLELDDVDLSEFFDFNEYEDLSSLLGD